jgi:hypothetical protein
MAALNGARGGVDIPSDERESVYNHLVRYYEKADKEPPALRDISVEAEPADESSEARTSPDLKPEAEGADPTPETTHIGDDEMDKEQAAELLTTLAGLSASVETLNERVASLGAPLDKGDPDPEPGEDLSARVAELEAERDQLKADAAEAKDLREKVERQEATIHRLATVPVRRAHSVSAMEPPTGSAASSHWAALAAEAGKAECGALASVFGNDNFQRNLEGEYGYPDVKDPAITRRMLERDLAVVLNAALADNVIVDPADKAGSWS